jgi:hypothetical protein
MKLENQFTNSKNYISAIIIIFHALFLIFSCQGDKNRTIDIEDVYPWCIVPYDSLERTPEQRVKMIIELGFNKYAYDWRKQHLDDMMLEFEIAKKNDIDIISVWLWLEAGRDSISQLSPSNEKIFTILKALNYQTTLWLSFNNNFFENLNHYQALNRAISLVEHICLKAQNIGCMVPLYNHAGWVGNPNNQIEIIKVLPDYDLSIVYNFHYAHQDIDDFPQLAKNIQPYLSAVNLNGMMRDGPQILTIGDGNYEKSMIESLINVGFHGPWGILGLIENEDARIVLERNLCGLKSLNIN